MWQNRPPRGSEMQFKNIGFRVPGLYVAASMALTEAHMSTPAAPAKKTAGVTKAGAPRRLRYT